MVVRQIESSEFGESGESMEERSGDDNKVVSIDVELPEQGHHSEELSERREKMLRIVIAYV